MYVDINFIIRFTYAIYVKTSYIIIEGARPLQYNYWRGQDPCPPPRSAACDIYIYIYIYNGVGRCQKVWGGGGHTDT